ncbi:hypothetical protein KSP40_PGU018125 [Platanthera guangdongensis]|uniref:Uncharacterized protein n=1 Tax=Platanthera guangdongensis TaxID=2320717 RepID=A0ABR2LJP5_9ASPA
MEANTRDSLRRDSRMVWGLTTSHHDSLCRRMGEWVETWLWDANLQGWELLCWQYKNGGIHAGEYFAGKMHGFKVYRFSDGQHYKGAWHEGNKKGLRMCSSTYGGPQSGLWDDDFLEIPSFAVNNTRVLDVV